MTEAAKPAPRKAVSARYKGGVPALSKVFILEDDARQLKAVAEAFEPDVKWEVHGLRSAKAMLDKLQATYTTPKGIEVRAHIPLLVVLDLNMQYALDRTKSPYDVLRFLWEHGKDETMVIVYSAELDSVNVRERLQEAHPRAWWRDKRDLPDRLVQQDVARIINYRFGDLELGGSTIHFLGPDPVNPPQPPLFFNHRIGPLLMWSQQRGVPLVLKDDVVATRAVNRFNEWLTKAGSAVRVDALGDWHYSLAVAHPKTKAE